MTTLDDDDVDDDNEIEVNNGVPKSSLDDDNDETEDDTDVDADVDDTTKKVHNNSINPRAYNLDSSIKSAYKNHIL